ncbi:MAG TPA: response regulator transcription factor [Puia sp.]|nr:response regulator transcription factor [Puia sp.]
MIDLRYTLAVVDDHLLFRSTVSRYLRTLGFDVAIEAENGMQLLRILDTCGRIPDACLLDIEMPLMDGVATCCVLQERYPQVKVIALTLSQDAGKRERIMQAGASRVVFKGIDAGQLKQILYDKVLAKHAAI